MLIPSLDSEYTFLDQLPERLYRRVITLRYGNLKERVAGIMAWRTALLAGRLPDHAIMDWPEASIARNIIRRIEGLGICKYCHDDETLTDQVLEDICAAIETIVDWRERGVEGLFDDSLDQTIRRRQRPSELERDDDGDYPDMPGTDGGHKNTDEYTHSPTNLPLKGTDDSFDVDADNVEPGDTESPIPGEMSSRQPGTTSPTLFRDADTAAIEIILASQLAGRWESLLHEWHALQAAAIEMGTTLGPGWDLGLGLSKTQDWQEFIYYRHLMKQLPELTPIIDSLGRSQHAPNFDFYDKLHNPLEAQANLKSAAIPKPIRSITPPSLQGVTRSDDIARMQPSEAAFLGHPILKKLWHLRRSEQALMCYQVEGVLSEHIPQLVTDDIQPPTKSLAETPVRGPIIICLDSSGSMHGKPETLAKAISLEVLRVAHQELRPCLLYAFSGPEQAESIEMGFTPFGFKQIVRFLQQSFHGGTEISYPFKLIMEKIMERQWQQADVLLISDGRFPVEPTLVELLQQEKQQKGLRIQGIKMGNWSENNLAKLCDAVHHFNDWQSFDQADQLTENRHYEPSEPSRIP